MLGEVFKRWRASRAKAAAKRVDLQNCFEAFLRETEPLVPPRSNHPKAALYRHAWKRAAVLGFIYQQRSDQTRTTQFKEFEKLAGERYFEAAPETLYGKAPLKMGEKTATRLLEFEKQRLFPTEVKQPRVRPLACIYIGRCDQGAFTSAKPSGLPRPAGFSIASDEQARLRRERNTSTGMWSSVKSIRPTWTSENLFTSAFSMPIKMGTMTIRGTI